MPTTSVKVVTPLPLGLRIICLFLVGMALSVVLEIAIFSTRGAQNYPLFLNYQSWFTKHILTAAWIVIMAMLMSWLWSQRKIVPIYERSRLFLLIALLIGSFVFLHLSQWVPSHVRGGILLIGCQNFNCLLRFIVYPFGLLLSGVVLGILSLLYHDPNFKLALKVGAPISVVILLFLFGQVAWQSQLNKQIPLQTSIIRSKTVGLTQGRPLLISVYNKEKPPGTAPEDEIVFKNKTDLAPYFVDAQNFTPQTWHGVCSSYGLSSLSLNVLGAGVAQTCDYIGAIVYKQPALCDQTKYAKACRTDVAIVAKDPSICQRDQFCLKHPLLQP